MTINQWKLYKNLNQIKETTTIQQKRITQDIKQNIRQKITKKLQNIKEEKMA